MAPRVPKVRASSLAATTTKKKEPGKGSISGTPRVATRRTAALDLSSVKGKGKASSKVSPGKQKEVVEDMDTDEEVEEEGLFSTPQRGSAPANDQTQPQVQVPSMSTFPTPPNIPAQPIFVLSAKPQEAPPLPQHLKINLKRPADPLGGSPIRKTARAHSGKSDIEQRLVDILEVVQELSRTVEKQTVEIQELKKLLKGAKGDQVRMALGSSAKTSTMASHIAANIASNTAAQEPPHSTPLVQASVRPLQSKGGPSIVIDLSVCDVQVKERSFLELRRYIEKCIQGFDETRDIVLKGMNKDGKKDHRFFLFFHTKDDEKKARIHSGNWLSTAFPRVIIQSSATYKVKVNNVRADAVIDLVTNRVTETARQAVSNVSGYSIARMGWLSGPGKKYGSMVVQFTQKANADEVLARGLIEVGGESACATVWMEKSKAQRCFKCQQFGHMAS